MLFDPILASTTPTGMLRRWFSSDGVLMAIDISASEFNPQIQSIHDALLLEKQEPLLNCIEHWLGCAFNWQPHSGAIDNNLDITLTNRLGRPRQVGLVLNAKYKKNLPPLSAEIAPLVCLGQHLMPVILVLDSFYLDNEDFQRLQTGSLLLMPASFGEPWLACARFANDPHFKLRTTLDTNTGLLRYSQRDMSTYDIMGRQQPGKERARKPLDKDQQLKRRVHVEVILNRGITIDRSTCTDAADGLAQNCSQPLGDLHSEPVQIHLNDNKQVLTGSLLRVGSGYGIMLEAQV